MALGCGPGDDSLECIDMYINQIKLQDGMEKRDVYCGPGEEDLACFDRHIQTLHLRQSKRSLTPLSSCLLKDDSLTCLDRYIRFLKLTEKDSIKRGTDCDPVTDRFGCLDRYVGNIKLRTQKRAPRDPFCPPGEDGLACFDRYVNHIKVQYLPSKRFAGCAPGDESVQCFGHYINDLKLKHSNSIKRSPMMCAPGEDSWQCFDQYINEIKLKSRNLDLGLGQIPRPERRSRLSLRSGTWPLCPPTINRVHCFDRYLILMLKSLRSPQEEAPSHPDTLLNEDNDDGDGDDDDDAVRKRAGNFCPNSMDNLECFHTYLSHWVISAQSPPKRTFRFGPGKRDEADVRYRRSTVPELTQCSVDSQSKACLQELMVTFIMVADIRTKNELDEAITTLCEPSKVKSECEQELAEAVEPLKKITNAENPKDRKERSICPSDVDQVRCFESLLHAYLHKVVPKGSTEFVGRR